MTVGVPGQDREDEIGEMATAVEIFKQNMIKNEEMRAEQEAAQQRRRGTRQEGRYDPAPAYVPADRAGDQIRRSTALGSPRTIKIISMDGSQATNDSGSISKNAAWNENITEVFFTTDHGD